MGLSWPDGQCLKENIIKKSCNQEIDRGLSFFLIEYVLLIRIPSYLELGMQEINLH